MLSTFDRDRDKEGTNERPTPQFAGGEGKPARKPNHTAESGEESREKGGDKKERSDKDDLIEAIEKFHDFGAKLRSGGRESEEGLPSVGQ